MTSSTACTTCHLGLHHCHAPIVEHADGTYECVDGCGGPRAIHDVVLVDEPAGERLDRGLVPAA